MFSVWSRNVTWDFSSKEIGSERTSVNNDNTYLLDSKDIYIYISKLGDRG